MIAVKLKVLSLTDEEHQFLVDELGVQRDRSQELLDDEIFGLDETKIGGYQDSIDGYKREVILFDAILKKL
jgi:hydrogenase maturation factor